MSKLYLMLSDIEGTDDIEFGVDWGLGEGESLPEDVEDLTSAQFAAWRFLCVLRGVGDVGYQAEIERNKANDAPTGILMPTPEREQ